MTLRQINGTKQADVDGNLGFKAVASSAIMKAALDDHAATINAIGTDMGDMATATTTAKTTVGAVNELNSNKTSKRANVETWTAPTLLNSWVNAGAGFTTAGYYKDEFGIVRLRGQIKSGIATAGTTLFTLPAGYRPASTASAPTVCNNGTSDIFSWIFIDVAGNVVLQLGANAMLKLDNITFRAEQ